MATTGLDLHLFEISEGRIYQIFFMLCVIPTHYFRNIILLEEVEGMKFIKLRGGRREGRDERSGK